VRSVASWFRAPAPVELHVSSRLPPSELAARIRAAVKDDRIAEPIATSPYVVRLRGTATDRLIAVEGRLVRADGGEVRLNVPLRARGTLAATQDGSRLDLEISARDRSSMAFAAILVAIVCGVQFVASGHLGGSILIACVAIPLFLAAVRAAERHSMLYVTQLERVFRTLAGAGQA
jgi:hypothetical protein